MASIDVSEEHGVRSLHFGSHWVQGAMRVARPWALELEYTRQMMLPLLLRPQARWPAQVLQLGLGAGSVTKFLYRHRPACRLTVVEILPGVVSAARHFFKLPEDDARLRVEIAEGSEFVAGARGRYDLALVDGFDEKGRSGMLDTLPFYLNLRERLSRRGLVAINLLSRRGTKETLSRLAEAFDGRVLALPPAEAGNLVALAATGDAVAVELDALEAAADALKQETGLALAPVVARLRQASVGGLLSL